MDDCLNDNICASRNQATNQIANQLAQLISRKTMRGKAMHNQPIRSGRHWMSLAINNGVCERGFQCRFTQAKERGVSVISAQLNLYIDEVSANTALVDLLRHAAELNVLMPGLWSSIRADKEGCYYFLLQGSTRGEVTHSTIASFLHSLTHSLNIFLAYTRAQSLLVLEGMPESSLAREQVSPS